jgi:hypothetical protein
VSSTTLPPSLIFNLDIRLEHELAGDRDKDSGISDRDSAATSFALNDDDRSLPSTSIRFVADDEHQAIDVT